MAMRVNTAVKVHTSSIHKMHVHMIPCKNNLKGIGSIQQVFPTFRGARRLVCPVAPEIVSKLKNCR